MLGHKRIPSREGGVEIVVEELAVRMVERGHEVTVYNRSGHHVSGKEFDTSRISTWKGVRIKWVPTIDYKGLAAMISSFFAAIACAFGRFDVVHFHAEGPCAMIWIPKLFRKRCIVTVHGLDHAFPKWGRFARSYILFGEWCAAKFADEIVVLNRQVQKYFMEKYKRNTKLIPNGIVPGTKRTAKEITTKFGLSSNSYVLYLGRIVEGKGIEYLLEAYQQCQTDKKLVIAGGASDSSEYMKLLQRSAKENKRIVFTGFIEGELLEELYSNAYIYVLPSDGEGMPLSLMEAMSYGNCCLVSDISGCMEVIGTHGVSFKKGSVEELYQHLQYLCDYPECVKEYRENSAEYILKKFSWDDVVDEWINIYRGEP
ncbi:MAG: glycosyltransferase family 4 protein [Clostridia bacterium]|nr:glycosyltransferase family 4 protein [Clostridia bacterium]